MSRTTRVVIAGVVSAGILLVGAGAAFADSQDDGQDYTDSTSQDSSGSLLDGLPINTNLVTNLVGGGLGL